jgi:hypothetical protein
MDYSGGYNNGRYLFSNEAKNGCKKFRIHIHLFRKR